MPIEMKKRRWYSGPLSILRTLGSVLGAFSRNNLKEVIPFIAVLYAIAFLLYLINLVSPLAPFVYSLF